jgi:Fe-S cluster biosynthesis and repair protein YggX
MKGSCAPIRLIRNRSLAFRVYMEVREKLWAECHRKGILRIDEINKEVERAWQRYLLLKRQVDFLYSRTTRRCFDGIKEYNNKNI